MQTYPCGHKVVCRRCFVKTIQIALSQRTLPLCCVICRTKILRLKHTESSRTSSSSVPPFHCRQSSRGGSKCYSEVLRSNISLEKNPWSSRNKYSRSLPGINSSFRLKSSVNRSHSGKENVMHWYGSVPAHCSELYVVSVSIFAYPFHNWGEQFSPANINAGNFIFTVNESCCEHNFSSLCLMSKKKKKWISPSTYYLFLFFIFSLNEKL